MTEPRLTRSEMLRHPGLEPMLKMQLYVVSTWPTKGLGPVMEVLEEHLAYQIELERTGVMFGAGPIFADNEEDWEGEGMVIVRAASLAKAREIAAGDPMHAKGARAFRVRPWLLNEGTVTVKLMYSNGTRQIT